MTTQDLPFTYTGAYETAEKLAKERQLMAHEGTLLPMWEELTNHERTISVLEAANYLTALDRAFGIKPDTAPVENEIVKVGSVWADNYPGNAGRTVKVTAIDGQHAVCVIETNAATAQARLDKGDSWSRDTRGRTTRILLTAFSDRARKSGYRPAEAGLAEATPTPEGS